MENPAPELLPDLRASRRLVLRCSPGHFNDAVLTVSELEARPQVLLIGQPRGQVVDQTHSFFMGNSSENHGKTHGNGGNYGA